LSDVSSGLATRVALIRVSEGQREVRCLLSDVSSGLATRVAVIHVSQGGEEESCLT
jgi:hypothetical protein